MHTPAIVLGVLLVANCGFVFLYIVRTDVRVRAALWDEDMVGLIHRPVGITVIPAAHFIGVVVGLFLLWWGLSSS